MRKLFLIGWMVVLGLTELSAQSGFAAIREAEQAILRGEFERGRSLLDSARSSRYGSCGNAYELAQGNSELLVARIEMERGKFEAAHLVLDSMYVSWEFEQDWVHLKAELLSRQFGPQAWQEFIPSKLKREWLSSGELGKLSLHLPLPKGGEQVFPFPSRMTESFPGNSIPKDLDNWYKVHVYHFLIGLRQARLGAP